MLESFVCKLEGSVLSCVIENTGCHGMRRRTVPELTVPQPIILDLDLCPAL